MFTEKDQSKAKRKRDLSKSIYQFDWYNNLHQYSKGKIHCSCPMCANKTNSRNLLGIKGNWKHSDEKQRLDQTQQIHEYLYNEEENG